MTTLRPDGGLAGMIGEVARALLGEPNRHLSSRRELRFGSKGSLAVSLDKGAWFDHEAGEGGGVTALVRRYVGEEPGAVARWLDAFGIGPAEAAPVRQPSAPRIDPEDEEARQRARAIWLEASPCLAGTPAEAYLRSRGICGPPAATVAQGGDRLPVRYVTEGDLRGLACIRIASIDDEHVSKDTANLWRCDGLSDWERNFVRGVREYHARYGQITTKQRRLIDKLCSKHLRKRKRQK